MDEASVSTRLGSPTGSRGQFPGSKYSSEPTPFVDHLARHGRHKAQCGGAGDAELDSRP